MKVTHFFCLDMLKSTETRTIRCTFMSWIFFSHPALYMHVSLEIVIFCNFNKHPV